MQTKLNISDSDILQGFGNFAEKTLKDFGCAGAAVAVIKDGEVILSRGMDTGILKQKNRWILIHFLPSVRHPKLLPLLTWEFWQIRESLIGTNL